MRRPSQAVQRGHGRRYGCHPSTYRSRNGLGREEQARGRRLDSDQQTESRPEPLGPPRRIAQLQVRLFLAVPPRSSPPSLDAADQRDRATSALVCGDCKRAPRCELDTTRSIALVVAGVGKHRDHNLRLIHAANTSTSRYAPDRRLVGRSIPDDAISRSISRERPSTAAGPGLNGSAEHMLDAPTVRSVAVPSALRGFCHRVINVVGSREHSQLDSAGDLPPGPRAG